MMTIRAGSKKRNPMDNWRANTTYAEINQSGGAAGRMNPLSEAV